MEVDHEEMAGVDPSTPSDPFAKMQAFMEAQFKNTNDNIKKMNSSISKVSERVGVNTRNLDRLKQTVDDNADGNGRELQKIHDIIKERDTTHEEEMKGIRSELAVLRKREPAPNSFKSIEAMQKKLDKLEATPRLPVGREGARGNSREDEYYRARRSIRIWPVPTEGLKVDELAREFIWENLRVPPSNMGTDEIEDVRRVAYRRGNPREGPSRASVHDEVVVRFASTATRDYVMGHVTNLAGFIDDQGKPTAGVRLEVPFHLKGIFQDLQQYGRILRRQHGSGFKRHVRFDDSKLSLYMDIRLPGTQEWLYVDHGMAAENRGPDTRKNTSITRERLASSVSSMGSVGDEVQVLDSPIPSLPRSATLEKFNGRAKKTGGWE